MLHMTLPFENQSHFLGIVGILVLVICAVHLISTQRKDHNIHKLDLHGWAVRPTFGKGNRCLGEVGGL